MTTPTDSAEKSAPALVSVIVRSMDRPSLGACLDSVLHQHWRPIEVVLVNALGGGHQPIAAQHGDLRLRVVQHPLQQRLSRPHAAQAGLDSATGEFALFLDDDDLLLPEHLSRLVPALQRSTAPAAFADTDWGQFENGLWRSLHRFDAPFDPVRLLFENYLPIHAVLFRRQLAQQQAQFDPVLQVLEDWDFWLQLAMQGDFVHVPGLTARYLVSGQDQTQVQSDTPAARAARTLLLHKWQQKLSPELYEASMQKLQSIYRQAAQAQAKSDILAAREHEISEYLAQQQNLHQLIGDRELELSNAAKQLQALQDLLAHREADLLAASQEIEALRKIIAAREQELRNAAAQLQATEELVQARETEINNWTQANAALQAQLTEAEAQLLASQTEAEAQLMASQASLAALSTDHQQQAQALALLQAESPLQALQRTFKGKRNAPG